MTTPTDQFADIFDIPRPGRGGRRAGAGRKPAPVKEAIAQKIETAGVSDIYVSKARKEEAQASMAELELRIKSEQYVSRDAVRTVSARMLATLAQALRSIPDNVERQFALRPEQVQMIADLVDDALDEAATALVNLVGDPEDVIYTEVHRGSR